MPPSRSGPRPPTKSETMAAVAEKSGMSKRDIQKVLDALQEVARSSLRTAGEFTYPGIGKAKIKVKPAVPAGMRKNPFTGETKMGPAKPASRTVKLAAVKALKDLA